MEFTPSEMMKKLRKERTSNRVCPELSKDQRFLLLFSQKTIYATSKWCLNELVKIIGRDIKGANSGVLRAAQLPKGT